MAYNNWRVAGHPFPFLEITWCSSITPATIALIRNGFITAIILPCNVLSGRTILIRWTEIYL